MSRTILAALLVLGCAPKAAPESSAAKESAPVTVEAKITEGQSAVTVTFDAAGEDLSIEVWGASGLEVQGPKAVWAAETVLARHREALTVSHSRAGDLAVRVAGVFGGTPMDHVQSFTVGDRPMTPVPKQDVDGQPTKGWEATQR